jgi:chromate reductase
MSAGDVLLVSGSLRRGSYSTALLREAANALPGGVGHVWLDGLAALPPYSEDDDGERPPAAVERLRRTIAAAAAVLIATPEYNGSIPGGLKNVVDWASRPFPDNAWRDKPVAVIGASTGIFGAVWAQAQLRKSLGLAGARVTWWPHSSTRSRTGSPSWLPARRHRKETTAMSTHPIDALGAPSIRSMRWRIDPTRSSRRSL